MGINRVKGVRARWSHYNGRENSYYIVIDSIDTEDR